MEKYLPALRHGIRRWHELMPGTILSTKEMLDIMPVAQDVNYWEQGKLVRFAVKQGLLEAYDKAKYKYTAKALAECSDAPECSDRFIRNIIEANPKVHSTVEPRVKHLLRTVGAAGQAGVSNKTLNEDFIATFNLQQGSKLAQKYAFSLSRQTGILGVACLSWLEGLSAWVLNDSGKEQLQSLDSRAVGSEGSAGSAGGASTEEDFEEGDVEEDASSSGGDGTSSPIKLPVGAILGMTYEWMH